MMTAKFVHFNVKLVKYQIQLVLNVLEQADKHQVDHYQIACVRPSIFQTIQHLMTVKHVKINAQSVQLFRPIVHHVSEIVDRDFRDRRQIAYVQLNFLITQLMITARLV